MKSAVAEAIGTFFLVLVGTGAVMTDAISGGAIGATGVALAFGFVVGAMIYAVGPISGAHINPAVTLGFWSIGRFPLRKVPTYLAAQCAGASIASFLLRVTLGDAAAVGATLPAVGLRAAFTIEWLLSFALMFVIVAVATGEGGARGFTGLAVGLTVTFDALMGGPLTGASMNPARSLGPALAGGVWTAHWLYWLAPVTAMMAAGRTYEALRPARLEIGALSPDPASTGGLDNRPGIPG